MTLPEYWNQLRVIRRAGVEEATDDIHERRARRQWPPPGLTEAEARSLLQAGFSVPAIDHLGFLRQVDDAGGFR